MPPGSMDAAVIEDGYKFLEFFPGMFTQQDLIKKILLTEFREPRFLKEFFQNPYLLTFR
jgi:hypothetical protein